MSSGKFETVTDHIYVVDENGTEHRLQLSDKSSEVNGQYAYYYDSEGNTHRVNSNMQAFVTNSSGDRTSLIINQG